MPGTGEEGRAKRLQRVLAESGVASRRACEELILAGRVEVNGEVVSELPAFVVPGVDRVAVDGRVLKQKDGAARKIYVMLHKPTRTLSTSADEEGANRRTVVDLVEHPSGARLFPVGRLDFDTTGLILLTNDGELANRLTHPRYGVVKRYHALVRGMLDEESVERLERGIYLAERKAGETTGAARTARVHLRIVARDRDRTVLEVSLREGRNRQVRRMLAAVGCPVKKLKRVAMGPVELKGLSVGEWRELTREELRGLRRAGAGSGPARGSGRSVGRGSVERGSRGGGARAGGGGRRRSGGSAG